MKQTQLLLHRTEKDYAAALPSAVVAIFMKMDHDVTFYWTSNHHHPTGCDGWAMFGESAPAPIGGTPVDRGPPLICETIRHRGQGSLECQGYRRKYQ
jgi:hypothetical protein